MRSLLRPNSWLILAVLFAPGFAALRAEAPAKLPVVPTAAEVADLLQREPITLASWPVWRTRLKEWLGDRSRSTEAAYRAAGEFLVRQVGPDGELPPGLGQDALAWYFLGSGYLLDRADGPERVARAAKAERAFRRSLQLDPQFARAHRSVAWAILFQEPGTSGNAAPPPGLAAKRQEAMREIAEAQRLDPSLHVKSLAGSLALANHQWAEAERHFEGALQEEPEAVGVARGLAQAILMNPQRQGNHATAVRALLNRFPDNGPLVSIYGYALAMDDDLRGAVREFNRARRLGTEPADVLTPDIVRQIEEAGKPGLLERGLWLLAYVAGLYVAVMLLMATFGVVLARRTRGTLALQLLDGTTRDLIEAGQVARTSHESLLARFYLAALLAGLVLFYFAIPFVITGLLAFGGFLLYLIFQLPRIPVKLIIIILVVAGGGAWAVFKSLFAAPSRGSFGIPKTATDCPRLHQVINEVAQCVETEPVTDLYLAPGSAIGVHQEGRGPFGLFGTKNRVLTLGLSTMNFLTVAELKSILAHEYAHFSHRDTFYNRFVYQVSLSIQEALQGMGNAGGKLNYVNPFYWFLYLYSRAYHMLSAGFSRSREFLADRMACSLYGADVFRSALTKVSTDGTLFEMTIYDNIGQLLEEDKAFLNMYQAFRAYRDEHMTAAEREELYQKLLDEQESLFASHPTIGERLQAVEDLPKAATNDATPALQLFEDPEAIEKELTEFLTGFLYHVRQVQQQAAAQG